MTPHSAPVASSTAAPAPTSARSSSRPSSSTFSKPSLTAPASFQNSNSNNSSSSGAHNRSASSSHSHRNASANHGQATTTPTASSKDRRSHRAKQNGDLNIAQQDPMTGAPSLGVECGADASGIDDQCFVCGLGGHLLLCDYPQCVRAYHQVCVARIFPESLDSQMCTDDGEGYLLGATGLNEPWFCPCHTCIGCHALQRTESTIAVQDMPYDLYERQKLALHCAGACLPGTVVSGASSSSAGAAVSSSTAAVSSGGKVRQKVLRSCCSCPVAVCDECENALSSGQTLLLEKRFTDVSAHRLLFLMTSLGWC